MEKRPAGPETEYTDKILSYGGRMDYMYNADGIRTQKTVNGIDISYILLDGKATAEELTGKYYRNC